MTSREKYEASTMLVGLAYMMEFVYSRMFVLLDGEEDVETHACELQGASEIVREWGERLR